MFLTFNANRPHCSRRFLLLVTVTLFLLPLSSNAVSSIFDKRNQKLPLPPKALSADSHNPQLRKQHQKNTFDEILSGEVAGDEDIIEEQVVEAAPFSENGILIDNQESSPESFSEYKTGNNPGYKTRYKTENYWQNRHSRHRPKRRDYFMVGLKAASQFGVMGVEADLYIDQHWSAGGGIGTSFDFQSWSLHARYQFELQNWRPFLEFGFAQWIMNNEVRSDREASPSQLVRRFLGKNPSEGDVANLLYPSGGLRYLLDDGFSVAANLVYLVNIEDSQGGLYGGMSFQYSY